MLTLPSFLPRRNLHNLPTPDARQHLGSSPTRVGALPNARGSPNRRRVRGFPACTGIGRKHEQPYAVAGLFSEFWAKLRMAYYSAWTNIAGDDYVRMDRHDLHP